MNTTSHWLEGAISRGETVCDWLLPKRSASLELLREAKWPNRKTEAWKYTSLYPLLDVDFKSASSNDDYQAPVIKDLESIDLLFVDGVLISPIQDLPKGLSICSFDDVSDNEKSWAIEAFSRIKPSRHLFGLVNDALAEGGLLVSVDDGAEILKPIRIINQVNDNVESHHRLLVRLGKSAKAVVIEQFVGNGNSFNTGFAEYAIADNASLEHYRFALQSGKAMSIGGSHFELQNKSELNSTIVGFGSNLSRIDADVIHSGEFANAKMNAIYLLDGEELFDLHTTIEHASPNGTTEENVRGIVADKSKAVFNGRIHIHRDAQKTLAELNNRNLLMSREAEINTKPELEIYADDVRCAHGATIAEIDKKAMYYLQSRGIDKSTAQVLLNFGFINELVDQMPNEALAEWLRPQLRERFSKMEVQ